MLKLFEKNRTMMRKRRKIVNRQQYVNSPAITKVIIKSYIYRSECELKLLTHKWMAKDLYCSGQRTIEEWDWQFCFRRVDVKGLRNVFGAFVEQHGYFSKNRLKLISGALCANYSRIRGWYDTTAAKQNDRLNRQIDTKIKIHTSQSVTI